MRKHYLTNRQRDTLSVVIKCFIGLLFISPLFVGLVFSFVPDAELFKLPTFEVIRRTSSFDNYRTLIQSLPVFGYLRTSLIDCVLVITVQVVFSSLAAYSFAFFDFKGKNFLFTLVLIGMMVPAQVITITNFLTVRRLGLLNTYLGLAVINFAGGKSLFLFRQYYKTLPREMHEAAIVDGCGDMKYLFQFVMPLAVPSIASVAIMVFIEEYNAYLWPILVARKPNMYTIQVGINQLIRPDLLPMYGKLLAFAVISLVIPVLAFVIGEDYLISGMTEGSVKG